MKKTIKINFCGMPPIFSYKDVFFSKLLEERFDVQVTDNPDYVFCSVFDNYSYCNFKGIRIFFPFECIYPDMNVIDYAFSFVDYQCGDRCCKMFPAISNENVYELQNRKKYDEDFVKSKTGFCNYIYSHGGMKERTEIFYKISEYKKVDAAGKYLNNMNGFTPGSRDTVNAAISNSPKTDFQKNYKFTVAFENYSYPNYVTEKMTDAFYAGTIPIYYGDPKAAERFNEKAFINVHNYNSFDEVLEVVKELDNDDEKFLKMLNEPVFNEENYIDNEMKKMADFLYNIFDQDYEKAFRRPRFFWPQIHEDRLKQITQIRSNPFTNNKITKGIYKFIKK